MEQRAFVHTSELRSTVMCPGCGHRETEIMPEDACQYFYKCEGCGVVLKPRKGDAGSRITSTPAWIGSWVAST